MVIFRMKNLDNVYVMVSHILIWDGLKLFIQVFMCSVKLYLLSL